MQNKVVLPEGINMEAVAMLYSLMRDVAQFQFPGEKGILDVADAMEFVAKIMRETVAEENAQ